MESKDHYAKVEWLEGPRKVMYGSIEVAKADKILELREFHGNFNVGPVLYFPNESISMEYFSKSETKTFCPLKGEASYFDLKTEESEVKDALWAYREPLEGVPDIKGHCAFFLKKGFEVVEG